MVYRIPARRNPGQGHRDGLPSWFTPGGVAIQSPPQWSPPSPKFNPVCGFCSALGHTVHNCTVAERYVQSGQAIRTPYGGISFLEDPENSQPDPYNSPALSDQSDAHLPNDLEKSIQIQIAALEKAKALILARKNVIPITTEDLHPQSPMQPTYPGDPNYPEDLNYPEGHENVTIEDYEPEIITLDFSRYELSEEPYQRPKGPMQPIPVDLDTESQVTDNVSNQLAIPSEILAQFRDNEETAATTILAEADKFLNDFCDDIFEYKIESTQSSHETPSSLVETRSMIWYTGVPEIQDMPPSPPALTSQFFALPSPPAPTPSSSPLSSSPECHMDTSLPFPPAIPLKVPPSLAPDSPTTLSLPFPSLSLPSLSLPQSSEQRLSPMSQTRSFLQSFVTTASLCSKIPKLPWYSRPQLSELAVSRENKSFDLGIDAEDPADIANGSGQSQPGDPLPFWGAPESLNTVGSHLATLSNH